MASAVSVTDYPIIHNACVLLKSPGIEILDVTSYQRPYPFCESNCQGNFTFGSFLRVGAISACPIKLASGMLYLFFRVSSTVSKLFIWAEGKESNPLLSSSMPMEEELMSLSFPQEPAPACHARK